MFWNIYIWWIIIDLILFKLFGWIFTQFLSLYRSVALTFRSKVNEKHKRSKTKLNLDNWLFSSKKSQHCKELNSKQKHDDILLWPFCAVFGLWALFFLPCYTWIKSKNRAPWVNWRCLQKGMDELVATHRRVLSKWNYQKG